MATPYDIKISPSAERQILQLVPKYQKIIIKLIETLAINPRPPGTNKIEGMTGLYSETLDHVRILYKVEEQEVLILMIK